MQVVARYPIPRALTEERRQDDQQQAFAITASFEENAPATLFVLLLQLDCLPDLGEFGLDKVILGVAVRMKLHETCQLGLSCGHMVREG